MDNTNMSFTVEKKVEGSYKTKRILMIIGIVLLYLLPFSLFFFFSKLSWVIFIIVPVWIGFVAKGLQPFIFCWVQWSYIYEVKDMGTFTAFKRYGARKPTELVKTRIQEFTVIAPLTEETKQTALACKNVYWLAASEFEIGENDYYALFKNEQGEDCAVVFECPEKMIGICKFYNKTNLTVKEA